MRIPSFLTRSILRRPAHQSGLPAVSLENIRVAAPCPMKWEQMTGDERVRHCQECKLNVYKTTFSGDFLQRLPQR